MDTLTKPLTLSGSLPHLTLSTRARDKWLNRRLDARYPDGSSSPALPVPVQGGTGRERRGWGRAGAENQRSPRQTPNPKPKVAWAPGGALLTMTAKTKATMLTG